MRLICLTLLIILSVPVSTFATGADVKLLRQARSQIKVVSGELQQRVAADVRDKGAENSLTSCRLQVAGLIDRLTDHSGWEIRRTAFKVRNPKNVPDPWEKEVLELFVKRQSEGVDLQDFEFAKVVNIDGQRVFRYMKPIVMQDFCLTCHGAKLAPALAEKIAEEYPSDQATGFQPGELRGAFSLLRFLPGQPPSQ